MVPAAAAIPLPDGTDPAVAALIGCCVTTGVGAVLKTAAVPAGASVAVIGLGGVGLSCVMGAVVAGASRIVAIDRVAAKLDAARAVGATDTILAGDDAAATIEALRDLTDGGPDFVFEAIGRTDTAELAIAALPLGGTAVLVGMTPLGARAAFEVYPFVDGSRRILGSNYGFAEPAIDFPRYAAWTLDGRLPVERLIDRRIGLDDVEDAFAAMRRGEYTRQVIEFGRAVNPPSPTVRCRARRVLRLAGMRASRWSGIVGALACMGRTYRRLGQRERSRRCVAFGRRRGRRCDLARRRC